MALLVEQLQWSDPLTPETHDPAFDDEVRALTGGFLPGSVTRVASSPWVRRAYLDSVRMPIETLARSEQELAGLVTSQENACRYCYGSARVRMKMIGFSDEMIDRIERNVQLVEAEPRERELVHFCRNLARSKPRPSRQGAREDARGRLQPRNRPRSWRSSSRWSASATASRRCWRCRPSWRWRRQARRSRGSGTSCRPGCRRSKPMPKPAAAQLPSADLHGPASGASCALLEGSPAAATLEVILNSAFSSEVLPRRTLDLIFAVIAHTLAVSDLRDGRRRSARGRRVLAPRARRGARDPGLAAASPTMEALLIPWARDTVWMPEQPARIQERTRPCWMRSGRTVLVEAVGAAALANSCVRLTMLQV